MADANSDATTATTTGDTAAGAADTSTETTGKPTSDEGAASSAATDKGDDQATQEDKSDGQGGDEGAGDSASQADKSKSDKTKKAEQNREAGKLRVTQRNENIDQLRDDLQTSYVDEADSDTERQIRELKADQYVAEVRRVNEQLQRDNEQAAREIDLFNPNKPETFNKDLLDRSLKRYARDCLTTDPNNPKVITGYRLSLLDYLREEAEAYGYGSKAQTPQKKATATAKMDAAAEDSGGSSAAAAEAKKTGKDSFDDSFLAGMDDPYARHQPKDAHTFSTS